MDRDAAYGPDNLADGCVPTVLAGICVQIGSKPAALLAVRRDRTVAQVPVMHAPAAVTVQVTVNCGQPTALRSNAIPAPVQPAAPEPGGQATLTLTGLGLTDPALDSGQIPGGPEGSLPLIVWVGDYSTPLGAVLAVARAAAP